MGSQLVKPIPALVPDPVFPLDAIGINLLAGQELFRVHSSSRNTHQFKPGYGAPTRFAFFGSPPVPVLYAAETTDAAIAESLLHDVPLQGGTLVPKLYRNKRMSRLLVQRELHLASFMGNGLRRLGLAAEQVTSTSAFHYDCTALWASAAYAAGFDGIVYMSRQCNSDRAYVFFGNRANDAFQVDQTWHWTFDDPRGGLPELITLCNALRVEVLVR